MRNLLSKLWGINLWNIVFSLFNFMTNFLAVKMLGVSIFGEYAILGVYISITSLIFIVIPPNLAVYKYQDDDYFRSMYLSFFLYTVVAYSFLLSIITYYFLDVEVNNYYLLLYAAGLVCNKYYDVSLQAQGKVIQYFKLLTVVAFAKCVMILLFFYTGVFNSINDLLLAQLIPQWGILLIMLCRNGVQLERIVGLSKVYRYIKSNITQYSQYYFNSSLKVAKEQIDIMLFSLFVTKEILGLFALFIKSISFFNSIVRVVEAYFVNRNNIKNDYNVLFQKSVFLGVIIQLAFVVFNILYIYVVIGKVLFWEAVIASFYFLLIVKYMLSRQKKLSEFEIRSINISQIVYIVTSLVFSVLFYWVYKINIEVMLVLYVVSNIIMQQIVIYEKRV